MGWRQKFDLPEDTPEHWGEFYESLRDLKELTDRLWSQRELECLEAMFSNVPQPLGVRQMMGLMAKEHPHRGREREDDDAEAHDTIIRS